MTTVQHIGGFFEKFLEKIFLRHTKDRASLEFQKLYGRLFTRTERPWIIIDYNVIIWSLSIK